MSTTQPPPLDLWALLFNATTEIIIIVAFAITLLVVWVWWAFLVPYDARILVKAKIRGGKRRVLVKVTGDEGHCRYYLGEPLSQGVLNIGTKLNPRYILLPRPFIQERPQEPSFYDNEGKPFSEEEIKRTKEKYESDLIQYQQDITTFAPAQEFQLRRTFLSSLSKPVYDVYTGKSIAVSSSTLAALGLSEPKGKQKNNWMGWIHRLSPIALKQISKKKGGIVVEELTFPYADLAEKTNAELLFGVLLDARLIKTSIPQLYTDAQLRKIYSDAYVEGQESTKGGSKNLIIPIMLIMVVIVIGVVIMKVLGVV